VSFQGKTEEAIRFRYLANALRHALGKGPLYDTKAAAIHAEEQYKQESEFPAPTRLEWGSDLSLHGHTTRPNSFRLKRSLAAEYKRKQLRFRESPWKATIRQPRARS
jgi:hypothetical protein